MSDRRQTLVLGPNGDLIRLEDCPAGFQPAIHWDVNERPQHVDTVLCAWHPTGKAFFPYYLDGRPSPALLATLIEALSYDATKRLHRGAG